jgi:dephospho-CoA kinase
MVFGGLKMMKGRLIALSGKMGSGKTTTFKLLHDRLGPGVVLVKFASPLYEAQDYLYEKFGFGFPAIKDRKLLQWLGTNWAREKNENVFVDVFKDRVAGLMANGMTVICDDCRFLNEAEAVRELGGTVIKINKLHSGHAESESGKSHASEKEIDLIQGDFVVDNDTIENLKRDITHIVIDILGEEYARSGS